MIFDPRYLKGVQLFNQHEFFACHDELEDLWTETLGPEREFYQGLIHAAVALFHFEGGNLGGARKMHDSASAYLSGYEPTSVGIDVTKFLGQMRHCFRDLLGKHSDYPAGVALNSDDIPVIVLETAESTRDIARDRAGDSAS